MGRREVAILAAITAAGALLRFATLDAQSFWLDEAFTVDHIEGGFATMLSEVADDEVTPPLYFAVLWVWKHLFGSGEVGLRSLSAMLGTATIPLAYAIANRLGGFRVGCFVAALTATSPLLVWYSQEARVYSLLILLGGLSLLCFLAAKAELDRRWLAGWVVSSALALAAHYFAVFLVAPELIWLLLVARRRGAVRETSIAAGIVVADRPGPAAARPAPARRGGGDLDRRRPVRRSAAADRRRPGRVRLRSPRAPPGRPRRGRADPRPAGRAAADASRRGTSPPGRADPSGAGRRRARCAGRCWRSPASTT